MAERLIVQTQIRYEGHHLQVFGASQSSPRHPQVNEDAMLFIPESNTAIIADGSSECDDGRRASTSGIIFLADRLDTRSKTIGEAKKRIHSALVEATPHLQSFGEDLKTTAVIMQMVDTRRGRVAVFGSVGDSRGYHYTNRALTQVTRDHSLVNAARISRAQKAEINKLLDELATKEQRRKLRKDDQLAYWFFEDRNWVVQILGHQGSILPDFYKLGFYKYGDIKPDIQTKAVLPGDSLLLATDGTQDNETRREMETLMRRGKVKTIATRMVQEAYKRSETEDWDDPRSRHDDMTVMLIYAMD